MKILLLAPQPFFQERGTPIAVRQLIEVLAGQGHDLDVVTYHEGQDIEIPNVTFHRIPALPGVHGVQPGPSFKKILCDIAMFFVCLKLVWRNRYDVIHAGEEAVYIALVMKIMFRVPYIYDMDSSLPGQMSDKFPILKPVASVMRFFERIAVRGSAGVVAVCQALVDDAKAYDATKSVVRIEDVSLIDPNAQGDEDLRETLGIDGQIIMYVGNLESYQGIDLLVDGFAPIAQSDCPAHLVVIGGVQDHIDKFNQIAADYGIASKTHFIGQRALDRLGYYLNQADILVSPRTQGANTPMKIYSYLDSGKPVVATGLPTHTQVLDDEIACLVDPTPESMADGLRRLIENKSLQTDLASAAQKRVAIHFSPEVLQKKLITFYQGVADSLPSARRPIAEAKTR